MKARAVWIYGLRTLTIGAISFGVMNEGKGHGACGWGAAKRVRNESSWISTRSNQPTKPGYVAGRSGEDIVIFDPAPQIDEFSAGLGIQDILRSDCGLIYSRTHSPIERGFWWNHTASGAHGSRSKIKSGRQECIADHALSIHCHMSSWCIAAVSQYRSKSPTIQAGYLIPLKELVCSIRIDECALVSDQGLFSQLSLSASGNPQGSGERRDNEGAKSGERPVMLLDKLPGTMAIGRDRAAESGWIFFGGVLFVGFLVPLYAGLKCWRERSGARHKGSRQKQKKE
jgi:hypothetical protein